MFDIKAVTQIKYNGPATRESKERRLGVNGRGAAHLFRSWSIKRSKTVQPE